MNQSNQNVSIIIPTFKGEKYIDSIVNTMKPYYDKGYEIIMVDDGSPVSDKTLELFKIQFPNAICVKQKNKGVAAARNTGAKEATKTYLQFLDVDDAISADKIEIQFDALRNKNADVVYSDWCMVTVDEEGVASYGDTIISNKQDDYIYSLLEKWWNPPHSYLIKKSAYEFIGGGDETLVNAQDFDVFIRLAIAGFKIIYQPGLFSFYYRYLSATSLARGSREIYWRDNEIVVNKAIKLLSEKDMLNSYYKKAAAQRLFYVARNVYNVNKKWNKDLMNKVIELDEEFTPKFESSKFKMLFQFFGYNKAEQLIAKFKKYV